MANKPPPPSPPDAAAHLSLSLPLAPLSATSPGLVLVLELPPELPPSHLLSLLHAQSPSPVRGGGCTHHISRKSFRSDLLQAVGMLLSLPRLRPPRRRLLFPSAEAAAAAGGAMMTARPCQLQLLSRMSRPGFGSGVRLRCRVQGVESRVQGAGCRMQGVGRREQGAGCRVSGVGCWV